MIAFLVGLTIIGVLGGITGLRYAKAERKAKHKNDAPTTPSLPFDTEESDRRHPAAIAR